ncbi:MAG: glycosyltransferase involved in cell wall biosynthesis [Candidatus Azotimanducaceae bacterium]
MRYERADLFVHCGIIELEGMSIIEAMATGKVVLVSDSEASAAGIFALNEFAKFKCCDLGDLRSKLDYWVQHPKISAEQTAVIVVSGESYRKVEVTTQALAIDLRKSGKFQFVRTQ